MNTKLALAGIMGTIGVVAGIGILAFSSSGHSEYKTALEEKIVARLEKIEKAQMEFAHRLEPLERQVEAVATAAGPSSAPAERRIEPSAAQAQAEIVQRLEKIEKQALQASAKETASTAPAIPVREKTQQAELVAVQSQATNVNLPIQERIAALAALRDLEGGRSREVVLSMIESVRSSQDHRVRRDIIRNLHRTEEPELKFLLIDILNNPNDDEAVRAKCAEDIDVFLDDPAANAALLHVAQNDKSSKVKSAAYEALAKWEKSKAKSKKAIPN